MKTRYFVLSLILLLGLFLAACSPQATPAETMSDEKEMVSETMDEEDEAMMDDSAMDDSEAMMEDNNDGAMDDSVIDDDAMDGDDAMMGDNEDDMMSDEDSMDDQDDGMMEDKDDQMDDHSDEMMEDKDDEAMTDEMDDDVADESMAVIPDWFMASLTDVNSGEAFTLADYKGKIVLVETLAMWCSNCLKQQGQVHKLHSLVGERDDFISVGLDIDPNENAEALETYTANNGFDWVYAVAPTEVAREIGQLYGDQFLNPPSTPMLIVDREGEVHLLPFGIKSAEDLLDALQPFLDAEM